MTAPALVDGFGIGPDTAATLLIASGSNPDRLHSEAAFASLCGVSPIPASSGKTNRHRLNRGGHRQAIAALHRIVVVRLRDDQRTQAYMRRRTTEGMSKAEVIRCLKRYVAREVFSTLRTQPYPTALLDMYRSIRLICGHFLLPSCGGRVDDLSVFALFLFQANLLEEG